MAVIDIYNADNKYDLIYADPPWPLKKILRRVRPNQKEFDYPTMSLKEISELPVSEITDDNCFLFLWTTQKFLPMSFDVMANWGFKYQRTITWDKRNGLCLNGFHNRTEFLLFGYKGHIDLYPKQKTVPTIFSISSKHLRHSEKPKEIRDAISIFGNRKVELFAREKIANWDCWGNEVNDD